ncbi:hypothetical protein LCGC14_0370160 [marine sediment metagenome]|uniref:Uncharacterized protein n=1 Tax=marine sediment metagenome TaxID=412755 RepID=A0A0F9TNL4_9ZZZZ
MPYRDKTKQKEAVRRAVDKHRGITEEGSEGITSTPNVIPNVIPCCCEEHRWIIENAKGRTWGNVYPKQPDGTIEPPDQYAPHGYYWRGGLKLRRTFTPNIEVLGITQAQGVQHIAKSLSKQVRDLDGNKVTLASMVFCGGVRLDELV